MCSQCGQQASADAFTKASATNEKLCLDCNKGKKRQWEAGRWTCSQCGKQGPADAFTKASATHAKVCLDCIKTEKRKEGGKWTCAMCKEQKDRHIHFTQCSATNAKKCDACLKKRTWKCSRCGEDKFRDDFTTAAGRDAKRRRCDGCAKPGP